MTKLISQNFTLAELTFSETATRLGIDNSTDDPVVLHNLELLARFILEPVREWFKTPFRPNSAYRSYALEEVLCAKQVARFLRMNPGLETIDYLKRKQHPTGKAADIEVPGVSNIDLARWIEKNLTFDQLILEFYSPEDPTAGWVHVSYSAETYRHEVLTIGTGFSRRGLPD